MPTRRIFFSTLAFGAAALWPTTGFGRRRRLRRASNRVPLKHDSGAYSRGAFPTGYAYRDGDVELILPDVTKWAKLELGMSPDDVRGLLGRPLEGEGTGDPDYVSPQTIADLVAQRLSVEETNAAAREYNAICLQAGQTFVESWIYGWLKLGDGELIRTFFRVAFQDRKVFAFGDAFGGGRNRHDCHVEARLSRDGRPTAPRLLTPYDNAVFTHTPSIVDFRWLPSCGEYPLEYVVEFTASDVEIDAASGTATHVWLDDRPSRRSTKLPHIALNPSSERCRWRVRAKNRLGTSDWSKYREFQFG